MSALQRSCLLIFVGLPMVLAGCASRGFQRFEPLQEPLSLCAQGSELVQDFANQWSREAYQENHAQDATQHPIDSLLIQPSASKPLHGLAAPAHWQGEATLEEISVFHALMLEHWQRCRELENGNHEDIRRLEQSAKALAQTANSMARQRGSSLPEASVAAALGAMAQERVTSLRRRHSLHAARQVQPVLALWIEVQRGLLGANRAAIQIAYSQRSETLVQSWLAASAEKKTKFSTSLMELNDRYATQMRLIGATDACLQTLAECNSHLADADGQQSGGAAHRQLHLASMRLAQCCLNWPKRTRLAP